LTFFFSPMLPPVSPFDIQLLNETPRLRWYANLKGRFLYICWLFLQHLCLPPMHHIILWRNPWGSGKLELEHVTWVGQSMCLSPSHTQFAGVVMWPS
jgi:hypothetical protein